MIEHVVDVPVDSSDEVIAAEQAALVAYLSAAADADDDPETNADDVQVYVTEHPDRPDLLRIKGFIDADMDAPYLKADYDPYDGIDPQLLRAAGL